MIEHTFSDTPETIKSLILCWEFLCACGAYHQHAARQVTILPLPPLLACIELPSYSEARAQFFPGHAHSLLESQEFVEDFYNLLWAAHSSAFPYMFMSSCCLPHQLLPFQAAMILHNSHWFFSSIALDWGGGREGSCLYMSQIKWRNSVSEVFQGTCRYIQ